MDGTKKDEKELKKQENKTKAKSKKKIILITIVIILVIVLACAGTGIYYYINESKKIEEISKTQEQAFLDFAEEIKYGQEISYNDLLLKLIDKSKLQESTNITLEINDRQINPEETFKFEEIGTYNIKIKLEYKYTYSIINSLTKIINSEKTKEILIEDKEKPKIEGVSNREITVGEQINLQDGITATDNVDGNIEVKIEGSVDNNKAGEYTIKVSATDKSGNTEESSFKVTVKEKPVVATNTKTNNTVKNNETNKNQNNNQNTKNNNGETVASSGNHVQDILRLTNQYRAEAGVGALTLDSKLSNAAQKRAVELVSKASHERPDGRDCFTILDEYNINYNLCGENIAYGQANGVSAAKWWRNSPGHYANMIGRGFKKIGIGVHNQGGRLYYVQLFVG